MRETDARNLTALQTSLKAYRVLLINGSKKIVILFVKLKVIVINLTQNLDLLVNFLPI